ncbi:common central domain of tyrosinase-domain-containing protein [Flammula alnicola]|nr:common central domain of tyrosinase-domain-containing protein [Flammula alnicola]
MSRVVITGATGGSPNRLEINDFVKNDKFFSLYVQALQIMSAKTAQENVESFFQVGGIHGLPYIPWDGVTGDQPFDPNAQWGGYCTHGSVLFPTWHRPYVMLYEQILQKHAQEVAATYTVDRASWVQAATQLRQPYWDWAANAVPPDQVIALKQVTITGPNGQKVTADNPLYHYKFHPVDPSFPQPYRSWPATLRQPLTTRPNATDNVARLKSIMRSAQSDITSSTYSMLTRVHDWTAFSNHTVGDGGSSSNSLEAIHDGIHVDVGGNGHMATLPSLRLIQSSSCTTVTSTGFSLFGLHSTRSVGQGSDSQDGTFILPPEAPVDQTTPLTPFWSNQTMFWASLARRTLRAWAVQQAIGNIVNQFFRCNLGLGLGAGPGSVASLAAAVPVEKAAAPPAPAAPAAPVQTEAQSFVSTSKQEHSHPVPHPGHHVVPPNQGLFDWTARIEFKKYELGNSFSVFLFLGAVPEEPEQWHISPNFVGGHHAFVNSAAGHCANCRNQGDLLEEGFVHLNQPLHNIRDWIVGARAGGAVLEEGIAADGSVAQLESLEVSVYGTPLSYPPGAMFPVPGQRHRYNHITHGRTGGSRHA